MRACARRSATRGSGPSVMIVLTSAFSVAACSGASAAVAAAMFSFVFLRCSCRCVMWYANDLPRSNFRGSNTMSTMRTVAEVEPLASNLSTSFSGSMDAKIFTMRRWSRVAESSSSMSMSKCRRPATQNSGGSSDTACAPVRS